MVAAIDSNYCLDSGRFQMKRFALYPVEIMILGELIIDLLFPKNQTNEYEVVLFT